MPTSGPSARPAVRTPPTGACWRLCRRSAIPGRGPASRARGARGGQGPDVVVAYDLPIRADGLRWHDLQTFSPRGADLPALLPEVWLHWAPKTVRERGKNALLHHRMDFLLLLPNQTRVVIEVDDRQHDADDGRASPARYAETMRADRDLRFAGYEVFRIGAHDLRDKATARATADRFFHDLFRLLPDVAHIATN